MLDILDYMVTPQQFYLFNHLTSASNPVYFTMGPGQLWYIKAPVGYPWDMYSFDDQWIYAVLTEQDWTNPRTFKQFTPPLRWTPRFPQAYNPPVVTPNCQFEIHTDCSVFTTSTLGTVQTQLIGPYTVTLGGDLPPALDVVSVQYQWNDGQTMELHTYARGYGIVQWQSFALVVGSYQSTQSSLFNSVATGATPALNFPCSEVIS